MPLEIKELHVKMVVEEPQSEIKGASIRDEASNIDMDILIAKCVKQILQILKDREER